MRRTSSRATKPEVGASLPIRDRVHEHYDYRQLTSRDWQWYEPMLARMHPVAPVLDVGAGLGLFLECCRHHGVAAVGIELSVEGVQAAAAKRLSMIRANLSLPFPLRDNSIGSAFAHHVLEHVPPETERFILKEIHRVLRPGGFVFAISPNVFQPDARDHPDHINLFTPHDLADEARRAGFRDVDLGTNFWRHFGASRLRYGRLGDLFFGVMWKLLPIDRF